MSVLLLKLYSSTLQSPCSSLPLTLRSKPLYELTVGDLSHEIEQVLGSGKESPFPQFKVQH